MNPGTSGEIGSLAGPTGGIALPVQRVFERCFHFRSGPQQVASPSNRPVFWRWPPDWARKTEEPWLRRASWRFWARGPEPAAVAKAIVGPEATVPKRRDLDRAATARAARHRPNGPAPTMAPRPVQPPKLGPPPDPMPVWKRRQTRPQRAFRALESRRLGSVLKPARLGKDRRSTARQAVGALEPVPPATRSPGLHGPKPSC